MSRRPRRSRIPGLGKVLIANRGEIAVRIARTLDRLGLASAAIVHPKDADGPVASAVDEVCVVDGETPVAAYLDAEAIVAVARRIGADAIHPGYGFLAENAPFAERVATAGLCFVGPGPDVIRLMGDKIASRRFVAELSVPLTPSASEEEDPSSFAERARALDFPLLVKASAGGGGKGLQIVRHASELAPAIELARSEARRYFADDRLYAERYLERPRHVEVQILADHHGAVLHLGERDCSIQRRFQKLVEETPAPGLAPALREKLHAEAVRIARAAGYRNAGTVEFVLAADGSYFFLEMNTRLQVEHPVTELVTGLDLVEQQLRIAAGEPLAFAQQDVRFEGAAIECRICAEDPEADFRPAIGPLLRVRPASGPGVRNDLGVREGQTVTTDFDPMLAKLVVHGADRDEAIARARRALAETVLLGCATNTAWLERILGHPAFTAGRVETGFVVEHAAALAAPGVDATTRAAVLAAAALSDRDFLERVAAVPEPFASIGDWRN